MFRPGALMDRGAIAQVGSPEELYATPGQRLRGRLHRLGPSVLAGRVAARADHTAPPPAGSCATDWRTGTRRPQRRRPVATARRSWWRGRRTWRSSTRRPAAQRVPHGAAPAAIPRCQDRVRVRLAAGAEVLVEQHAGKGTAPFAPARPCRSCCRPPAAWWPAERATTAAAVNFRWWPWACSPRRAWRCSPSSCFIRCRWLFANSVRAPTAAGRSRLRPRLGRRPGVPRGLRQHADLGVTVTACTCWSACRSPTWWRASSFR